MKSSINIKANAKINLSLDVLGKRKDGYHDLVMIMQELELSDIIYIEELEENKIEIYCDNIEVPTDSSNIVYKISYTIKEHYGIKKGVKIGIEKNIPLAAGLAGGSADAAATIIGLNELWNLDMSEEEMIELSKFIGADIPFCLVGKTALAEGIGEKLTKLYGLKQHHILLVNPGIEVSTKYIFENLDIEKIEKRPDTERLIEAIKSDDIEFIAENMVNVLETVTIPKYSIIGDIKSKMIELGAIGSMMSGSGPTVFGIFKDEESLIKAENELIKYYDKVIRTRTVEGKI